MTTETTLQNFLDKHIEATLNRTAGRWEYTYYPAGDNTNPTRFHTAPLPTAATPSTKAYTSRRCI